MSSAAAIKERTAQTDIAKRASINLRITEEARELIDAAAAVVGKSRTEFMLESARQRAIDVLLDQRLFALDDAQYRSFMDVLQSPPRAKAKLKKLLCLGVLDVAR